MEQDKRDRDVRDQNKQEREVRSEYIPVEESGRKGGAASMAAGMPVTTERAGVAVMTRDLVRWGPIWAGLLLALGIQLVLGAIGLAVALGSNNPAAANYGERVASTLSIWNAISALIALFIGGYVAGRMAAVLGLRNGLTQGSVVWALALLLGVLLSAFGVAGVLGAATNTTALITRGLNLGTPEAQRAVQNAVTGTWWFVVGAVLAWLAAAGGGILGAAAHRETVAEDTGAPKR